jgi:outer membrane receptor protein involved in Fe transport
MVEYDVEDNLGTGSDGNQDFSRFSPKVGATYDLTSNLNLFASYSQGFVVPTIGQLFTGRGSSRALEPEKADNYEVGLRSGFWGNRLKFDVSLYHMTIDDKIIVQTIDPVTSAIEYRNVGETSHKGIETTLALLPWDWMNLALSYTYAENIYEEFDDPITGIDFSGNWMPLAPKNRLNARVGVIPIDRLSMELEVDLQDEYYVDDANTDTYDTPTLLNLRGSYDWRSWSIWAHVLNLTDEKYATRVTASNGIFSFFPGNPRTFFIGLSYQWGKR